MAYRLRQVRLAPTVPRTHPSRREGLDVLEFPRAPPARVPADAFGALQSRRSSNFFPVSPLALSPDTPLISQIECQADLVFELLALITPCFTGPIPNVFTDSRAGFSI